MTSTSKSHQQPPSQLPRDNREVVEGNATQKRGEEGEVGGGKLKVEKAFTNGVNKPVAHHFHDLARNPKAKSVLMRKFLCLFSASPAGSLTGSDGLRLSLSAALSPDRCLPRGAAAESHNAFYEKERLSGQD